MRNSVYSQSQSRTIDEGLRSYMLKVYNFMAGGLCLTGLSAWLVANTSLLGVFFNITPQKRRLGFETNTMFCYNICRDFL